MPSLTQEIPLESPLHRRLVAALAVRVKAAESAQTTRQQKWKEAEESVLAYLPESELDAKRRNAREGGTPAYTTIQLPYSYALLMSAHTYWTSVFFARDPIHQYAGRHGETEQQSQALEALIAYQVYAGRMLAPYYIWLYDAGKYGVGILGTHWERNETYYSSITSDVEGGKELVTSRLLGYEGNKVTNVSPFDFLPDPRVTIGNFQQGEFVAVKRRLSWNTLVRRASQGYYMNLKRITTAVGTTDPAGESHSILERPGSQMEFVSGEIKHPAVVEAYEIYIELIPQEWGLGQSSFPEKWVFTITSDFSVIFGATPLGAVHGLFPFDVLEIEIEGYGLFNRGVPEIMEPVQHTMDWLINSHFFNVRSSLNNLFLADPTRLVMKDFENAQAGGFIRLKPEAYGQDLNTFFHQIPIADVTQQHMNDINSMQQVGERIFGINDQIMGVLSGGGRKTATEVRTSTGFGVNRQKTITEYMSATGFTQHSDKLVMNSQQYYDAERKFRIVGTLAQEAGTKFLSVSPEDIQGNYDFISVDGTLPVDRFAQANLWKEMLSNIAKIPQVGMQYDLGRIFAWVAHLAGLKNINQFKVQVLPPGMGPSPGMMPIGAGGPAGMMTNPAMTGLGGPAVSNGGLVNGQ